MDAQCRSCGHKEHRGRCSRKASSRCTPLGNGGFACGARPPCPCPWRTCRCGVPVAVAACDGEPEFEETVERGSANAPEGTLAVRKLADGTLMARPLRLGEPLKPGEYRAVDHDARCPKAAARASWT